MASLPSTQARPRSEEANPPSQSAILATDPQTGPERAKMATGPEMLPDPQPTEAANAIETQPAKAAETIETPPAEAAGRASSSSSAPAVKIPHTKAGDLSRRDTTRHADVSAINHRPWLEIYNKAQPLFRTDRHSVL